MEPLNFGAPATSREAKNLPKGRNIDPRHSNCLIFNGSRASQKQMALVCDLVKSGQRISQIKY